HCDPTAKIGATAPEVRRVRQYGVDDQGPAGDVGCQPKAHPPIREPITTLNLSPDAVDVLVDDRLALMDWPGGGVQDEVAPAVDFEAVGAVEVEDDAAGIGAWAHDDVVLQLALVAVIDDVDARVDVVISHLGIDGDVRPPGRWIVPDEVVHLAGQFFQPAHAWSRARVGEGHSHDGRGRGLWQRRFAAREPT